MDAALYWKQQFCPRCQRYVTAQVRVGSKPVGYHYEEIATAFCNCGQFLWAQAERGK